MCIVWKILKSCVQNLDLSLSINSTEMKDFDSNVHVCSNNAGFGIKFWMQYFWNHWIQCNVQYVLKRVRERDWDRESGTKLIISKGRQQNIDDAVASTAIDCYQSLVLFSIFQWKEGMIIAYGVYKLRLLQFPTWLSCIQNWKELLAYMATT